MKRRFAIFNLVLMAVVLLTTAWQSFHSFSHEHYKEHHDHDLNETKASFVADDHDEDCATCDFHFDYYVAPQEFCLKLDFPYIQIPYSFSSIEGSASFAGSLFALRAPPSVL